LAVPPFLGAFDFDFFGACVLEAGFALLGPPDVEVEAIFDLVDFFLAPLSEVVALATDFRAFIGVPLRISSPIVSAVLATGLFPRADCSPTIVPATPPAIAPTGPPTIPPRTAPVTPPTACLETEIFFSADTLADGRVDFHLDFLAIVLSVISVSCAAGSEEAGLLKANPGIRTRRVMLKGHHCRTKPSFAGLLLTRKGTSARESRGLRRSSYKDRLYQRRPLALG